MLREQVYKPLLGVHGAARVLSESALVLYYTSQPYHLGSVERALLDMELATVALRGALEAIRSRGEDPLKDPPKRPVPDEVPW